MKSPSHVISSLTHLGVRKTTLILSHCVLQWGMIRSILVPTTSRVVLSNIKIKLNHTPISRLADIKATSPQMFWMVTTNILVISVN